MFRNIREKINKKWQKGFTLVESLISITILTISIAGPLSLAGSGLLSANIAQKHIIAYYLAQDATEFLINKKVQNKINLEVDMLKDLNDCITTTADPDTVCSINTFSGDIFECNNLTCLGGVMKKSDEGFYKPSSSGGISGYEETGYTRYSQIEIVDDVGVETTQAKITTTVKWKAPNGDLQTYELVSYVSKW